MLKMVSKTDEEGLTLIEVLGTIIVASLVFFSLYSLFSFLMLQNVLQQKKDQAMGLASALTTTIASEASSGSLGNTVTLKSLVYNQQNQLVPSQSIDQSFSIPAVGNTSSLLAIDYENNQSTGYSLELQTQSFSANSIQYLVIVSFTLGSTSYSETSFTIH